MIIKPYLARSVQHQARWAALIVHNKAGASFRGGGPAKTHLRDGETVGRPGRVYEEDSAMITGLDSQRTGLLEGTVVWRSRPAPTFEWFSPHTGPA